VIIQTHQPGHVVLRTLLDEGYDGYVRMALQQRMATHWPPFWRLAMLRAEARQENLPLQTLQQLAEQGKTLTPDERNVQILGPMPAAMAKRRGLYRAQLLVRACNAPTLHAFLQRFLPPRLALPGVRLALDVDPMDLL
jgi:primosomal protein N' (replication factor Y)